MRGREFMMKDMYSVHATEEDFWQFYEKTKEAYSKIFKRIGFDFKVVEASGGVFTDKHTHEFQALNAGGEDTIYMCDKCGLKPAGPFVPLQPVRQKGGKIVHAWAFQGDGDPATIRSNTFVMEWSPKPGQQQTLPEIDRAEFFDLATPRRKIKSGQVGLIDELETIVELK